MTLSAVVVLGTITAVRYATGYARTGQQMFGAVALGAVLLVQAQLSLHFGEIWKSTFWLYHLQLIAGFFAILWGVVVEYSRGRTVKSFANLAVSDAVEQLRSGYAEPILALSAALEARDGYTLGHGDRVAAMSVLIGQEMRLSAPRLRGLAAGALLPDVGTIGIPDAVLHKGGRLTEEEFAVIQEHPDRGFQILRYTFGNEGETHVVRHHHEKWDGSGYPDGLAGEAIPLEARIAAVADVYDALRSNRAYREPMTPDAAREVIRESAGSHFDPACVAAFLAVADAWERQYAAAHAPYAERRALSR
jgi:HD-GYP domain-containing protein (c-di-GMP phosphodiesterase class II)